MQRAFRLALGLLTACALASASASAVDIVLANGLAPPNPANVIDDAAYASDFLYVRNVGCPPGWPSALPTAACPSAGASTAIEIVAGGEVEYLWVFDSSRAHFAGGTVYNGSIIEGTAHLDVTGGTFGGVLNVEDTATATISGGSFPDEVHSNGNGSIEIQGGTIAFAILAQDTSRIVLTGGVPGDIISSDGAEIRVVGSDFAIDGVPTGYGPIAQELGTLTGTLLLGTPLNEPFARQSILTTEKGAIVLVPPPAVPTLGALAGAGLWLALLAGARGRVRS